MTTPVDKHALLELLNALVDQRISSEQFAGLQKTLKSSPEARAIYLEFIDLHLTLRQLERMEIAIDPIADTMLRAGEGSAIATTESSKPDDDHVAATGLVSLIELGRSWLLPGVALFATAAALMMVLSVFVLRARNSESSMKSIAESKVGSGATHQESQVVLAQAVRASFFGELTPSLNSAMQSNHEYALTSGIIELHFPTGATTILEAPAVFSIASASRLVLQTGQCSVHAPDGAEGFQVETPLTNIVDLGTRFSVAVDETGETDVQVVEGIAEVFSTSHTSKTAQSIRLTDRQGRVYSESDGVESQPKAYDDSQYRRQLPDRVVSYQADDPNGRGAVNLIDITVQRDGQLYTYSADSLIGIELIHFKSESGKNVNPIAYSLESDHPDLAQIVADRSLNTGVINPGGAVEPLKTDPVMASHEPAEIPNTPGMGIRFRNPIVNDVGPDIVLFDLQTFTNPPFGDAFHIGPVTFEPGLRSHTVRVFDITLNSKEAKVLESFGLMRTQQPINSLGELEIAKALPSRVHTLFRGLAVGIDLSDLGYNPGASVDQIFIQDALDDKNSFVDPVLIVGLPPVSNRESPQVHNKVTKKE